MKRRVSVVITVMLLCIISVYTVAESNSDRFKEGLDFPVQNVVDLEKSYCFGLQPWDMVGNNEIHGGIDLAAIYSPITIGRVPIIAPADARVERIVESVSGAGVGTLIVLLKMNKYWYIVCNFEPQTTSPEIFEEQRRSIVVQEKQKVKRGELIGELVLSDVKPGSYPHLHFAFFYKDPEDTLEYIQENILKIRRSDGTDLAPNSGPGSPWQPRDLEMETTLYCPYEYSTSEAKTAYDSLPRLAANGDVCNCVCAYGSIERDCGVCK